MKATQKLIRTVIIKPAMQLVTMACNALTGFVRRVYRREEQTENASKNHFNATTKLLQDMKSNAEFEREIQEDLERRLKQ